MASAATGCPCAPPPNDRGYDVGVPLGELPRSRVSSLSALVGAPTLAYAEVREPRLLVDAVRQAGWFQDLEKSGALGSLMVSGPAAVSVALIHRLNDLSRNPIGEEALADILEGPVGVGLRQRNSRRGGGYDVLLVKSLPPTASGALRLAGMLEAVHASAQEVRVERYQGIPLRLVQLDGERALTYFVLRDRLVAGSDLKWVEQALDVALGIKPEGPDALPAALRARATDANALAVVDGKVAEAADGLGVLGRSLAGLDWVALEWTRAPSEVQLGLSAATSLDQANPALPSPPGAAMAVAREIDPRTFFTPSPPPDGGSTEGLALLSDLRSALEADLSGQASYALVPEPDGPQQSISFGLRDAAATARDLQRFTPRIFREAPQPHEEIAPGTRCVGAPPRLCWVLQGPALVIASSPTLLHQQVGTAASVRPAAPAEVSLAPSGLAGLLLHTPAVARASRSVPSASPRDMSAPMAAFAQAFKSVSPIHVRLSPTGREAWGTWHLADGASGGAP